MKNKYLHRKIEKKATLFKEKKTKNKTKNKTKKKYISMFPYPSGKMHIGHVRNYVINDVICRKKGIKMFMGWDSFGLPAENFSIKNFEFPIICIKKNTEYMKKQMKKLGLKIKWRKEFKTCDTKFYYWTQHIFQEMFKNGFIKKKKCFANWDPKDKTTLSNEQIVNKRGWRSGSKIKKKIISVYFLKLSKILEKLIKEIKKSKWPSEIKKMQLKWIGKENGFLIKKKNIEIFLKKIEKKIKYLGISINNKITKLIYKKNYIFRKIFSNFEKTKKKTNMLFGFYKTKYNKIPLFISNKINYEKYFHVIDINFIKDRNIIIPSKNKKYLSKKINIKEKLKKKPTTIYKMLDWNISRQRYWGTPIPIIKCKKCGIKKSKIPVKIPLNIIPNGKKNPLKKNKKFLITKCPLCKKKSQRETDTLDTFFDSSWYYLFYIIKKIKKKNNIAKPINTYIGGIEHSILHLLYSRIFLIILKQIKFINFKEPFKKLIIQGLVLNETYYYYKSKKKIWISKKDIKKNSKKIIFKKIKKMSKSKNNGVNPEIYIKKYGADALRLYVLFLAPIKKNILWQDKKIIGCYRFIKRFWKLGFKIYIKNNNKEKIKNNKKKNNKLMEEIKNTEERIKKNYSNLKFNIVISLIMKELKTIKKKLKIFKKKQIKKTFEILIKNINPICPFFSNILWRLLGIKKKKGGIENFFEKKTKKKSLLLFKKIDFIIQINNVNKNKIKINNNLDFYKIIIILKKKIKDYKKIYFLKNKFINFVKKTTTI